MRGCRKPNSIRGAGGRHQAVVQAAGAVITLGPVGHGHAFDADDATGAGRVHEAVVAQVDAHVRIAAAHRVEEDQIAGLEFVLGDGHALLGDFGGVAG
ncbi:hypothetical protein G6F60_015085 [Rhizopus arrhizus]|nr:hypothetical protein G6F60_015085 [Rhizopus arrhizus]